ncbi:MAG: plasmid pRiA4b ORF-3 family protein [Chloroflexi bacterium]|nr:plasmid pRiA4b ORF-3 family protein [Chloroflexota bacterium]
MVKSNTTLDELYTYIQIAFEWEDCHLHRFSIFGDDYSSLRRCVKGSHGIRRIRDGCWIPTTPVFGC